MKFLKLLLLVSLLSTNIYADENATADYDCENFKEGCLKGQECEQVLKQGQGNDDDKTEKPATKTKF